MNDIITVKDLQLWYGQTKALKGVSMNIPEKSITALIGPSGCGKSTFLKTLDRMNDLVPGVRIEGEVKYNGQDIFAPSVDINELRREIGMVFQKPNPFPMSIYDNIAYGPRTHGVRKKDELDEIVEQSLRGAAIWDEVKDRLNKKLVMEGVVFTMYDARTNLSLQVVENVKDNLNQNIYKTIIPRNVRLAEAPSYGMPINLYDPKSKGTESYLLLAEEVINKGEE